MNIADKSRQFDSRQKALWITRCSLLCFLDISGIREARKIYVRLQHHEALPAAGRHQVPDVALVVDEGIGRTENFVTAARPQLPGSVQLAHEFRDFFCGLREQGGEDSAALPLTADIVKDRRKILEGFGAPIGIFVAPPAVVPGDAEIIGAGEGNDEFRIEGQLGEGNQFLMGVPARYATVVKIVA